MELDIEISKEEIKINGVVLQNPISREVVVDILGESSRKINRREIYDDHGLYFLLSEKDLFDQANIVYFVVNDSVPEGGTKYPHKTFKGNLKIDGQIISSKNDLMKLSGYELNLDEEEGEGIIGATNGIVGMSFEFNLLDGSPLELCIWYEK